MQERKLPRRTVLLLGAALAGWCAGCSVLPAEETTSFDGFSTAKAEPVEKTADTGFHLRDNDALYTVYDDSGVVTMYLTVTRGTEAENTDHTWEQINSYSAYDYEAMQVPRYQVEGLLQVGDESGPAASEVGYGETVPNATVQIRGQTSSRNAQKNYKIKLKKNKGSWRGQRTVALNKHQGDGLRFRNKMAYDLIRGIPQMMGLRTQFVHLYVKDKTQTAGASFVDHGLYTQVEQPNKTALRAHGLDENGQLYKVNFFEFLRYGDVIRLKTDPAYDKTAFEQLLEIKGSDDHQKLIEMLDVLNDETSPMEDLFETTFDTENIAYWMAFQILLGNTDTQSRNMYLYSPLNSKRWYILDWDNDAMLSRTEWEYRNYSDSLSWERGVSNYWGNVLFRRCLQTKRFRQELDAAIEELFRYFSADRIGEMTARYRSLVEPFVWQAAGSSPRAAEPGGIRQSGEQSAQGDHREPGSVPGKPEKAHAFLHRGAGAAGRRAAPDVGRLLRLCRRGHHLYGGAGEGLPVYHDLLDRGEHPAAGNGGLCPPGGALLPAGTGRKRVRLYAGRLRLLRDGDRQSLRHEELLRGGRRQRDGGFLR